MLAPAHRTNLAFIREREILLQGVIIKWKLAHLANVKIASLE